MIRRPASVVTKSPSRFLLMIECRIHASNKPLYREPSCTYLTKIRPTRRRSSQFSFKMHRDRGSERDIFMRTGPRNFDTSKSNLQNRNPADLSDCGVHDRILSDSRLAEVQNRHAGLISLQPPICVIVSGSVEVTRKRKRMVVHAFNSVSGKLMHVAPHGIVLVLLFLSESTFGAFLACLSSHDCLILRSTLPISS